MADIHFLSSQDLVSKEGKVNTYVLYANKHTLRFANGRQNIARLLLPNGRNTKMSRFKLNVFAISE